MVIEVSDAARIMVETAAKEASAIGLPLRIAAVRTPEGGLDYRMGFDDEGVKEGDSQDAAGTVTIVVAEEDRPLLEGTRLDYVEIEQGDHRFIFDNPNDPSHAKKKSEKQR
jgi:iron-sulfur cluster assembly protein